MEIIWNEICHDWNWVKGGTKEILYQGGDACWSGVGDKKEEESWEKRRKRWQKSSKEGRPKEEEGRQQAWIQGDSTIKIKWSESAWRRKIFIWGVLYWASSKLSQEQYLSTLLKVLHQGLSSCVEWVDQYQ